jgi:predicted small secreted protein
MKRTMMATFLLAGLCIWMAGCNSGTQEGDKGKDSIDTPQVVKVEPQDFPVNNLPDSLFGKWPAHSNERVKLGEANLTAQTGVLPDWLDQILSRESIVLFANGILRTLPDEVEFVQTESTQYTGPDGWKAFVVNFTTRPSNAAMVVYGAYLDEQKSYWASHSDKGKLAMTLKTVKANDNGVELWGEWTQDTPATPFHATLTKNKTTIAP